MRNFALFTEFKVYHKCIHIKITTKWFNLCIFGSTCFFCLYTCFFIFDSVCGIFLLFFFIICVVSLPERDFVLCTLKYCETPWETSFKHSARTTSAFHFWSQKHPLFSFFFFFFNFKEDKTGTSAATDRPDKHSF